MPSRCQAAAPAAVPWLAPVQRVFYPALVAVVLLALWQGLVVAFECRPSWCLAGARGADAGHRCRAAVRRAAHHAEDHAAGLPLRHVLGVLIAFAFVQSRVIETALFPYAVLLQVTPIVAIAPLIIIWVKTRPPRW
jgi:NitT/TauT family transport system permease protein